jgi:hypothetical protein
LNFVSSLILGTPHLSIVPQSLAHVLTMWQPYTQQFLVQMDAMACAHPPVPVLTASLLRSLHFHYLAFVLEFRLSVT